MPGIYRSRLPHGTRERDDVDAGGAGSAQGRGSGGDRRACRVHVVDEQDPTPRGAGAEGATNVAAALCPRQPALRRQRPGAPEERCDGQLPASSELAGEPFRRMVPALQAPVSVRRDERNLVGGRRWHDLLDDQGGERREPAQPALLPGGDERPDRREWPRTRAQTPAVILYTSGSDGSPKGVIQTHTNFMQKTRVCADAFGTTPADRFAIFSTYTVGQGIMTALNALLFGAALCPYDVRHLGLEALAAWLKRERITIYVSSASLFRSFVRGFDGSTRFDDLRMIRIGGERVTPADVAAYRRVFTPTTRLLISYSATETGPISMHWVDDNEQYPDAIVPVGRPADGVTILIVGDDGRELGAGDQGEIVVRSARVRGRAEFKQ